MSSSSADPILKVAPPLAPLLTVATGTWGRGKEVAEVGVAFRAVGVVCDVVVDACGGGPGAAVRRP